MEDSDRYLLRLVPQELANAVLERRPRVVHLVDEEDALPRQLLFGFLDPLHRTRELNGFVVGVVISDPDSQDRLAQEGTHDPRRNEAPRADSDDDVGLEARGLDPTAISREVLWMSSYVKKYFSMHGY